MLVKATNQYEKNNVEDSELKRIPKEGEQWEVTEERYNILKSNNSFGVAFVEKVEKEIEVETAVKQTSKETADKKITKKKSK